MTPTAAHPAVAPVGTWDRLAIVALGFAGCALSYDALQQMAVAIHIRGFLTYLFPLVIDGFIAYGVRALLVLAQAPWQARLYIWTLFGTATAASIWANALHAVRLNQQTTHSGLRLSDTVVAVLSTLAPLALAGAVHLYILITRHHPGVEVPVDHTREVAEERTASADQPRSLVRRMWTKLRRRGNDPQTTDRARRTTDHQTDSAPADHVATAADQQTKRTPERADQDADHAAARPADHDAPAADRLTASGPPEGTRQWRTSSATGQPADSSPRRADHEHGRAEELGPAHVDQGAPADQDHLRTTDHTARTADQPTESGPTDHDGPAPDQRTAPTPADHDADHTTDQPADQDEDDSSGGPQGARTADRGDAPATPRAKPTDQDDEVPWEVKVEVARKAALEEGRMTRQAIRPHLRRNNISISNALFSDLQAALYADPALAHLPHPARKAR
ncbi:DUF2637 domain-containing protein [Streptomyces sp. CT34]|uniref:DUF2637 domain-containing protein n=1 Tax=Streptomyces sp. CT34 TaxID=1553907 RepID=UPI0005BCB5A1|nr:DUF2637 domain-containing protein [Streptomyces sp. CT34]